MPDMMPNYDERRNRKIHIPPFMEDPAFEKRRREVMFWNRVWNIIGIVLLLIGCGAVSGVIYLVIHTWVATGVLK